MKYLILFFCLIIGPIMVLRAQIPDIQYASPAQAIGTLKGPNVTVSNPTFSGNLLQLATFTDGSSKIGFENGIVLTTGNAEFATRFGCGGCANQSSVANNNTDSDLSLLSGSGNIKTPAVLEFDFVTTGSMVEFEIVFASEEYPEEVNQGFNDAFGLFLSGPMITGSYSNNAKNIAQLPNGGGDISIDNVNGLTNTSFYIDNQFSNPTGMQINENNAQLIYDGLTTVIRISENIICGATYHLKIALCNTTDTLKDSAVFLKSNSLRSDFQLPPISADVQPICAGQNLNLQVQGENNWTYAWSTGQTGVGLKNITVVADPNTTTYSVTATNQDGCSLTQEIDVSIHSQANVAPATSGVNNTGNYTYYIQANSLGCFNISTFDSSSESVSFTGFSPLPLPPNASIQLDGAFQETGQFCWTPTSADIGSHTVTVTITDDNACGSLSTTETFTIKVICEFCPVGIFYENRHPNSNPLPTETEAGQFIVAGTDVDVNQTNGTVETGTANVLFQAGEFISLEPGFTAGQNFTATLDTSTCIAECNSCCEDFTGFTFDFLPNVFTPNGDGINDVWYVPDSQNPFCAFSAQEFNLVIKTPSGSNVYLLEGGAPNECCPFRSPPGNGGNNFSSIFWDGIVNTGIFEGRPVPDGTYFYVLELKSCGETKSFGSFITIFGSQARTTSIDDVSIPVPLKEFNAIEFEDFNQFERKQNVVSPSTVNNNTDPNILSLYPNPAENTVSLRLNNGTSLKGGVIEIYTFEGKRQFNVTNYTDIASVDISKLSVGVYYIKVIIDNTIYFETFIKK